MSQKNTSRRIANLFGAAGYFMVSIQWLWLTATLILPLLSNDTIKNFVLPSPSQNQTTPPAVDISLPPFVEMAIVVLSIIFAVVVVIYAIYMVPRTISRTGHSTVTKAASFAVKQTTQQQKIKPRQRQLLTTRYIWLLKLIAILIPLALLVVPTSSEVGLTHDLVIISAVFLAAVSTVCFTLQISIAYITKLPYKNLW